MVFRVDGNSKGEKKWANSSESPSSFEGFSWRPWPLHFFANHQNDSEMHESDLRDQNWVVLNSDYNELFIFKLDALD